MTRYVWRLIAFGAGCMVMAAVVATASWFACSRFAGGRACEGQLDRATMAWVNAAAWVTGVAVKSDRQEGGQ
jgi:hypothetical protein